MSLLLLLFFFLLLFLFWKEKEEEEEESETDEEVEDDEEEEGVEACWRTYCSSALAASSANSPRSCSEGALSAVSLACCLSSSHFFSETSC